MVFVKISYIKAVTFSFRRIMLPTENARRSLIREFSDNGPIDRDPLRHGFLHHVSHWNPGRSSNAVLEKYVFEYCGLFVPGTG